MKSRFFWFISFLLLLTAISSSKIYAASNFTTDYDVSYQISSDQNTHVNFNIILTNTSSIYYASSYKIQIGFKDIRNVRASDSNGPITPSMEKNGDGTIIGLDFNRRVVGISNKLYFNLNFDTKDVAQKLGRIWEINIPGLSNQNDFSSFNVHVIVPSGFGFPAYVKPEIRGPQALRQENKLSFTKNELGKSGISITYGKEQVYKFNLFYHLENKNLFPVRTEIALPPTTNYQNVQIDDISPKPVNVRKDEDGNWLAQYYLLPLKKVSVEVRGKAIIGLTPGKEVLPPDKFKDYLKQQPYWQRDKKIRMLAQTLKTPYEIYQYVVDNLKYDFSRVVENKPRLGAIGVLQNPTSAVCLEFTDLFIALARAAGIPAREVDGYAYTQNSRERPLSLVKDVLHAWPEYYDSNLQAWVMIDPTWGNTTLGMDYFHVLDFDHFAFVIKGESSSYPIPAGGYKQTGNENSKDVNVTFARNVSEDAPVLQISALFPAQNLSGMPVLGDVVIRNIGKVVSSPQQIKVDTGFLDPLHQDITFSEIPPYGFISVPVSFKNTPFLTNRTDTIRIALGKNYIYQKVIVSPFFINKWVLLGGGIFAGVFIVLSIIALKTWRISLFRQKK